MPPRASRPPPSPHGRRMRHRPPVRRRTTGRGEQSASMSSSSVRDWRQPQGPGPSAVSPSELPITAEALLIPVRLNPDTSEPGHFARRSALRTSGRPGTPGLPDLQGRRRVTFPRAAAAATIFPDPRDTTRRRTPHRANKRSIKDRTPSRCAAEVPGDGGCRSVGGVAHAVDRLSTRRRTAPHRDHRGSDGIG